MAFFNQRLKMLQNTSAELVNFDDPNKRVSHFCSFFTQLTKVTVLT
jgi:hypothetical protein